MCWPWVFWANPTLLTAHCKVNCSSSHEVYLIWSCSPLTLLPVRKTTVLSIMLQASKTTNTFPVPQYVPVWAQIHIPAHTSVQPEPIPLKVHESVCSKCGYINIFIHTYTHAYAHKNFRRINCATVNMKIHIHSPFQPFPPKMFSKNKKSEKVNTFYFYYYFNPANHSLRFSLFFSVSTLKTR